jgi:hypothetical protein
MPSKAKVTKFDDLHVDRTEKVTKILVKPVYLFI